VRQSIGVDRSREQKHIGKWLALRKVEKGNFQLGALAGFVLRISQFELWGNWMHVNTGQ
jgi:hypothetical protein